MGKMLCSLAEGAGCEVIAKVDIADGYDREWPKGTEGVIDFSFHAAVPAAISKAAEEGIPYVIGTTGLTADEQKVVDAAAKKIPVVQSGNYSLRLDLHSAHHTTPTMEPVQISWLREEIRSI